MNRHLMICLERPNRGSFVFLVEDKRCQWKFQVR